MNKVVAILLGCLVWAAVQPVTADESAPSPRWSFEFKGGQIKPEQSDWKRYYGSDAMYQFSAALGYAPLRALQFGAELGFSQDNGHGLLPSSGTLGGEVNYTLVPVHVYLTIRGAFTKGQWLVPYVGGGWTRAYYNQEVVNQQSYQGHADGWNARAGLQLLLNPLDPQSAKNLKSNLGVEYTYLILEAQKFSAKTDGTDLGGESYLLGFRVEY